MLVAHIHYMNELHIRGKGLCEASDDTQSVVYVFRKVYRAEHFCRLIRVKVLLDRFWADCDNWTGKRSEQRLCCCAEYLPIQPVVPVGAQKENVWLQLIHRLS